MKGVRWGRVVRCESAYESTSRTRVWRFIYPPDDSLVRLNCSIGAAKVIEIVLRQLSAIRKLALGIPSMRLCTTKKYLICPIQCVPTYPFVNDIS